MTLFGDLGEDSAEKRPAPLAPLAERMRPASLDEYLGQEELLGKGRSLRAAIEQGCAGSLVLFGPPGVGKTTLGLLIANHADLHFQPFSAVLAGVAQVCARAAAADRRCSTDRAVNRIGACTQRPHCHIRRGPWPSAAGGREAERLRSTLPRTSACSWSRAR